MVMLALDTSTRYASVALVRERELVAELTWQAGQRHSNDLFERLNWLLAAHHLTPVDLTAIAVATGPGSFNGVRVALATAKSLSFALSLPLYASPTLDIIAWGAASAGATGTLYALLEAGRGQVYTARYRSDRERQTAEPWKPLSGYDVLTPGELAQRIAAESLVVSQSSKSNRCFSVVSGRLRLRRRWPLDWVRGRASQQQWADGARAGWRNWRCNRRSAAR